MKKYIYFASWFGFIKKVVIKTKIRITQTKAYNVQFLQIMLKELLIFDEHWIHESRKCEKYDKVGGKWGEKWSENP